MAATRLIALHVNKGKTAVQSLGDRTDYAMNPKKTENGALISSYECSPETVDEEFMLTKRQYYQITGKTPKNDVIAYQIRQSFKPGEITPEEANRLGYELAMRFTKGKYAFVVATHTDRPHIHNYIAFNSTALDGTRKFKNFWLSGLALQRCSDLVCLENGYSVITPRPYKERQKKTVHPKRESFRDILCADIDTILERKPQTFDAFWQMLQEQGYEVKIGKQISLKRRNQKRFIRLSSLPEGYQKKDLLACIEENSSRKSRESSAAKVQQRPFNLLIDIQEKLQGKGEGYKRWATVYNLKQMSKTLLFLRDHKIESVDQLNAFVSDRTQRRDMQLSSIQESEKRLDEIKVLKRHIINYSKTRSVYEDYRKAGYSKKFLEDHREEITIHKAAKAAFDELGVKKLPRIKDLSVEYAQVLENKKAAYAEYRLLKNEVQELVIAQRNVALLYEAEEKNGERKNREKGGR